MLCHVMLSMILKNGVRHVLNLQIGRRTVIMSKARDLSGIVPAQRMLLNEPCIVVDENDKAIRAESKLVCHKVGPEGQVLLHRAFSCFLFNSKDQLLLQQRANQKITFPGMWANTCCSHPLFTPDELDELDHIGVKRAVIRRLGQELGIPSSILTPADLKIIGRIHYYAVSEGSLFGEHELDYMVIIRKDIPININSDEVQAVKYVDRVDLNRILDSMRQPKNILCPWLDMVSAELLPRWWDNLHSLDKITDLDVVRFNSSK